MAKPKEPEVQDELAMSIKRDHQTVIMAAAFNASFGFWLMLMNPFSYVPELRNQP